SLGSVNSINRRDAYRTYVHLDTEGGWLTGKPRLPVHISEKLTCDGILQPVWHTQGAPVNVGRAQRIVPPRTRRLVEDRDRGCRFPGCEATPYLECHHLIHWVDGGPTDTWNLACLCPFHHDGHHDGDFTITGDADDPDGLTFTSRSGYPIKPGPTFITPTHPPTPARAPDSPGSSSAATGTAAAAVTPPATAPPEIRYRGPTGESLDLGWVSFSEPREPVFV
ncbi:MAG TPA: HNH endonuclease signature motif containing protein, partial [Dermatophilaceae bacterium]